MVITLKWQNLLHLRESAYVFFSELGELVWWLLYWFGGFCIFLEVQSQRHVQTGRKVAVSRKVNTTLSAQHCLSTAKSALSSRVWYTFTMYSRNMCESAPPWLMASLYGTGVIASITTKAFWTISKFLCLMGQKGEQLCLYKTCLILLFI